MKLAIRPSIFSYLFIALVVVSLIVATLLLLANRALHQTTQSLEGVVVHHVRPLAAIQRLQSGMYTLRSLELELLQFEDFFAVPYHLDNMQKELLAIEVELAELRTSLQRIDAAEAKRLDDHWMIFRESVRERIALARDMDFDSLGKISSTRSRGAHEAITSILGDLIKTTEKASSQAYRDAQLEGKDQQLRITLTFTIGLVLLFAGLWVFGRSMSKRIIALNSSANAIARGAQVAPITITGHDEITDLGRAFNTMQSKILEREDELRSAHERIAQRAQTAEEATLAKSQFLANMSHEIRTPMNGVLGMLEILRETRMSPEQQDYVATAHESATALLDLLNDILDLSKIEAGKVRLERIEYDFEQVVDDTMALLAERAHAKGLLLSVSIDPGLPHHLWGDPNRLRQVLNNLLSNAIKFTAEGHVTITAAPTSSHDGRPLVHVEVSDTGIGIPPSKQARIFDAFTQADGSTTRRFGGTGLGLTISSQLVHAMGGQIGVDSTPGQGSNFWFTMPLEAATSPAHLAPEALEDLRLLLVVGDGQLRSQLVRRLAAWGCSVEVAANAVQITDLAQRTVEIPRPFRLILLAGDPQQDSRLMTTLDQLRTIAPQARILLLTPPGKPCSEGDLKGLGVDLSLAWPVRKSQLKNGLLQLLNPDEQQRSVLATRTHVLRVLVAEDNPINQKVATSMLRKIGCEADVAGNGLDALSRYRSGEYDLVFMDCQMPGMDGFEATEAIRKLETGSHRVPIVAMTAHAMPSDRERCLAAGMDDYLTKPISVEQLRAVIARWQEHAPVAAAASARASR